MSALERLASTLDPILRERVGAWRASEGHPPSALLAELLAAQDGGEPWGPALVVYALETEPKQWPLLQQRMALLRAGWRPVWEARGRPDELTAADLSGDWGTVSHRQLAVTVGWRLERALQGGRAPIALQGVARALLPGRYLPSLGWQNLADLPDDVLALLIERSNALGQLVPAEHRLLAKLLFHHRERPWAAVLACAAAALLGERGPRGGDRNAPMSIVNTVKQSASVIGAVFAAHSRLRISAVLRAYVAGQYGGPSKSVRAHHVEQYLIAVEAQARLIACTPGVQTRLEPYLLPRPESPLNVAQLLVSAQDAERTRRTRQVDTLMPYYSTLVWVVATRAAVFRAIHAAATRAREKFRLRDGTPVPLSVRLADGSATLLFRMVSVAQLDQEARGVVATRRARPALTGQVLTEFLGAQDDRGTALADPFFVTVYRAWYDPAVRAALVQAGYPQSDFAACRTGLLRAPGRLGQFCGQHLRAALAAGRTPQVLLDTDSMCAGVAYGALALMLSFATGMRLHEMQQIRLEDEYVGLSQDGSIHCVVEPKARKRSRRAPLRHIIPAAVQPYWREVVRVHDQLWLTWKRVHIQNGIEMGLSAGVYLFQTRDTALRQTDLQRLTRYVVFGMDLNGQDGRRVNVSSHLLRHGYGRARIELGHSLAQIQAALSHWSPDATYLYTGPVKQLHPLAKPASTRTLWEALLPIGQEER